MKSISSRSDHKGSIAILILLLLGSLSLFAGAFPGVSLSPPLAGFGTSFQDVLFGRLSQSPAPVPLSALTPLIETDRTGYFAGSTVQITGSGYLPGQVVTLQVVHIDGTAEAGGGHEAFTVTADELGGFTATWLLRRDPNGNNFSFLADNEVV